MQAQETIYYQDGGITITNARAVLGAKTYAMANVTSVSTGVIPASRAFGIILAILGVLGAASGCVGFLVPLSMDLTENAAIVGMVTCVSVAAIGLLLLLLGVLLAVLPKDRYTVRIGSSSGETDALISRDQAYIQKIVISMNEAIVNRG